MKKMGDTMNAKDKCLSKDRELYCKQIGVGRYQHYQIFKGEYFFSEPSKSKQTAWELALFKLINEETNNV